MAEAYKDSKVVGKIHRFHMDYTLQVSQLELELYFQILFQSALFSISALQFCASAITPCATPPHPTMSFQCSRVPQTLPYTFSSTRPRMNAVPNLVAPFTGNGRGTPLVTPMQLVSTAWSLPEPTQSGQPVTPIL